MTIQAPAVLTRALPVHEVRAVRAEGAPEDAPTNVYEFVASTENPIRVYDWARGEVVREILRMDGLQDANYVRNPVVLDSHRSHGSEHVVGKRISHRVENGELIVRIEFDDEPLSTGARNLRLVRKGMLRALSIGYVFTKTEEVGIDERSREPILARTEWEWIETSTTPIPADPDALKRSMETAMQKKPESKTADVPEPETPPAGERSLPPTGESPPALSLEEERAKVREFAEGLTADRAASAKLARTIWAAGDDALSVLEQLQERKRLLHARVLAPELRELGGKLLAEAESPLEIDVLPALRKALEERDPIGTPEPTPKPKSSERSQGDNPSPQALASGDVIRLMKEAN